MPLSSFLSAVSISVLSQQLQATLPQTLQNIIQQQIQRQIIPTIRQQINATLQCVISSVRCSSFHVAVVRLLCTFSPCSIYLSLPHTSTHFVPPDSLSLSSFPLTSTLCCSSFEYYLIFERLLTRPASLSGTHRRFPSIVCMNGTYISWFHLYVTSSHTIIPWYVTRLSLS